MTDQMVIVADTIMTIESGTLNSVVLQADTVQVIENSTETTDFGLGYWDIGVINLGGGVQIVTVASQALILADTVQMVEV